MILAADVNAAGSAYACMPFLKYTFRIEFPTPISFCGIFLFLLLL